MEINYISILVCGVVAMIVGFIWYGPLFGKKWMEIIGAPEVDEQKKKEMQKGMMPMYILQFVLVLGQVYVLSHFVKGWAGATGIETAVWIWLGFVMPTIAASVMWTNESKNMKIARFGIQAGYQLVLFVIFGFVLGVLG